MRDRLLIGLWKHNKKIAIWFFWFFVLAILGVYFYGRLTGEDKTIFIPGKTSHGHYQIETVCTSCHVERSDEINQDGCLGCHTEKMVRDSKTNSHRAKLFEADDKAGDRKKIRADRCVTCHAEHKLGMNGVTQPGDFCILCHKDIADDRPSHKDLPFNECGNCHSYHDNSANYSEDFIQKHLGTEPHTLESSSLPERNFSELYQKKHHAQPLFWGDQNAPATVDVNVALEWDDSGHAKAGVNCQSCHMNKTKKWIDKPDHSFCTSCHKPEVKGFLSGKHGMRLDQQLTAMTTDKARLPMKKEIQELSCVSCHKAHRFDTVYAEVEGCLGCHNDQHSRAYKASKHYQLWISQDIKGASCATCHLPKNKKGQKVSVQHNQNDNLRPNQKMAKNVCVNCHGLGFSFDALEDPSLISNNFTTHPAKHIPMLEMWEYYFNNHIEGKREQ
jgi:hypothetical protein